MERMSKIIALIVLGTFTAVAARADDPRPPPRTIAPPTRIPNPEDTTMLPEGKAVPTTLIPREVRRAVVADAAKRFKVAESAVVLTRAEQLDWPDGSLGCPEPGRVYTQMLVPGFRVVAKTVAGEMLYHTDTHGTARNCALVGVRPPSPAPEE